MPFKPGHSGNPGGRRAKSERERNIQRTAQGHTETALSTLVRNLVCGNPAAEVAAAKEILDRGWGKATQVVHATLKHTVETGAADTLESRLRPAPASVDDSAHKTAH